MDQLTPYLDSEGYISVRKDSSGRPLHPESKNNPFTVFVIQGKSLYRGGNIINALLGYLSELNAKAEDRGYLFIFSDVRRFSDAYQQVMFNNLISAAFLFDNIGDFVGDRGNKSVFGEMDAKELKAEFAKCSLGDGYFYDTEADKLMKMKVLDESEELIRLGLK